MGKNKIKMWYDEDVDILYISLREGEGIDSEEIKENLRVEYNKKGEVIGLEISNISKLLTKTLAEKLKQAIMN
ncbi:MAG: DUF2283 domain-containing protein [Candidatus Freyrarchaeum guaymaensis]|nr:DUF2283 domain-containing protein [Candidatus Sigynarchaeota archaeon]